MSSLTQHRTRVNSPGTTPSIKHDVVRGVGWTGFAHGVRVVAGLLTTCVLAWEVGAAAFGIVAGATIVVGFLMLLKDLGTGAALIQMEELDPGVVCSVFWANTLLGCLGTAVVYGSAPYVAAFFSQVDTATFCEVLRELSFMLVLGGLGGTHQSLLQRELRFALLAKIEIAATLLSSTAAIAAAFAGAGVYALVIQALGMVGLSTLFTIVWQGWRPGFGVRISDLRSILRFSLNLTGFNIVNYFIRSADQLLILKVLGETEVGVYAVAMKLLLFPLRGIHMVLGRVLFPLFARIQGDDVRLRSAYLKVVASVATFAFPCVVGIATVASPLVSSLFPEEWRGIAPILCALAVVGLAQSVISPVGNIYMAKARTDLQFYWGIFSGICAVGAFWVGVQWGALGVAWSYAVVSVLLFVPGAIIPLRLIRTSFASFLGVLARPALATALMGVSVLLAAELSREVASPPLDLACRVAIGVLSYVLFSRLCNMQLLRQIQALGR